MSPRSLAGAHTLEVFGPSIFALIITGVRYIHKYGLRSKRNNETRKAKVSGEASLLLTCFIYHSIMTLIIKNIGDMALALFWQREARSSNQTASHAF